MRWPKSVAFLCLGGAVVAVVLGLSPWAAAESPKDVPSVSFERLSIEDGLSDNTVNSILQDRDGFLWFATFQGLNRFDGERFVVYRHDPADPGSLGDNQTRVLFEDRAGHLWVGCYEGLNRLDRETGVFTRYRNDPQDPGSLSFNRVRSVAEDARGTIWVATLGGGLNALDPATGRFTRYQHDPANPRSLSGDRLSDILFTRDGTLWVATRTAGLNRWNGDGTFTRFAPEPGNAGSLPSATLFSLCEDRAGNLWIGSVGGGLIRFDRAANTFTRFTSDPARPTDSLASNTVNTIVEDHATGRLWLTTTAGLSLFDPATGTCVNFHHRTRDPASLTNDLVYPLCLDRAGTLWLGPVAGGVNRYSPGRQKFRPLMSFAAALSDPSAPELSEINVMALHEERAEKSGGLWIATRESGLLRFDPAADRFTAAHRHRDGDAGSLVSNNVRSLLEDRAGNFWVGTLRGLDRLDRGAGAFTHYLSDPKEPASLRNHCQVLHEDAAGTIWVGTDDGLWTFAPSSGTFSRFGNDLKVDGLTLLQPNLAIAAMTEDRDGNLWVGTVRDGLLCLDRARTTLRRFQHRDGDPRSLARDAVNTLFVDARGTVWIGTADGGLDRFDQANGGGFAHFSSRDGLPSDVVVGMADGDEGELWVATASGLVRLDPRANTGRTFDAGDGLATRQFDGTRVLLRVRSGEVFAGTVAGINRFFPREVGINPRPPKVVLTDFRVFNRPVRLPRAITTLPDLQLTHRDSFVSFGFAALDFTNPAKNRYAYRLDGFDRDWVQCEPNQRNAAYTNLPAGRFTLRVKASNNDGVWNHTGLALPVRVLPPPWATWWAFTLYGVGAMGSVLAYTQWRHRRHIHALVAERRVTERLEEANVALARADRLKDEFLANTSHELRTPLHGIIGLSESLLDGAAGPLPTPAGQDLGMIASSARRLASLVNDILDFSKLKNREITLQTRALDLRSLGGLVLRLSAPLIEGKPVTLRNDVPEGLPAVLADENRLQQILLNLLGNALKFTERGEVVLSAERRAGEVEICVHDTGIGILADKHEAIFKSFEQADASTAREYGGTGLGLSITRRLVELHGGTMRVESAPGAGSRFFFTLPVSPDPVAVAPEVVNGPKENARPRLRPLRWSVPAAELPGRDAPPGRPRDASSKPDDGRPGGASLPESTDAPAELSALAPTNRPVRVLIVDDEAVNRRVLANQLGLQRYAAVHAADGAQALAALDAGEPFDLVLLDVMMPRMSGYEVCQKIRERHDAGDLPIIMLTAKNGVEDLVEGLAVGANDFLAKPFNKNELLARMQTHLRLARTHAAAGRFVPREFLRQLGREHLSDLTLGEGVGRDMTVLFADIRDFTGRTETMTPRESFDFLNRYLSRVGPVIRRHGGFIDKFIGDAVMALFPSPETGAWDALRAADGMLAEVAAMNAAAVPGEAPLSIGVGVHTGGLLLGTIGEEERMEGTVISDVVNAASRLEGLCQPFGASVIVSAQTLHAAGVNPEASPDYRALGRVRVKGRRGAMDVYESLSGADGERKRATRPDFERGLARLAAREFAESSVLFSAVLRADPADRAARRCLERAAHAAVHGVPADWDGTEGFTDK